MAGKSPRSQLRIAPLLRDETLWDYTPALSSTRKYPPGFQRQKSDLFSLHHAGDYRIRPRGARGRSTPRVRLGRPGWGGPFERMILPACPRLPARRRVPALVYAVGVQVRGPAGVLLLSYRGPACWQAHGRGAGGVRGATAPPPRGAGGAHRGASGRWQDSRSLRVDRWQDGGPEYPDTNPLTEHAETV